ncbi:hypothetical protein AB0M45_13590 [Nocardia sp. NPDC051787]|uniref:hypothetical protein n=1 Tax=Nocardia sp. NPDC051787 TaxID=3155415 RepID=UPI00342D9654
MPDNGVNIGGGNVVAGNIGGTGNSGAIHGRVTVNGGDHRAALQTTIAQLRNELIALRALLTDTEGPYAEPADVDEVIEALGESEPDLQRATGRWSRLVRRIPEAFTNIDTLTRIVDLFEKVRALAE